MPIESQYVPQSVGDDPSELAEHVRTLLNSGHEPSDPAVVLAVCEFAINTGGDIEAIAFELANTLDQSQHEGVIASMIERAAIAALRDNELSMKLERRWTAEELGTELERHPTEPITGVVRVEEIPVEEIPVEPITGVVRVEEIPVEPITGVVRVEEVPTAPITMRVVRVEETPRGDVDAGADVDARADVDGGHDRDRVDDVDGSGDVTG